jgi:hypothetical protein
MNPRRMFLPRHPRLMDLACRLWRHAWIGALPKAVWQQRYCRRCGVRELRGE